MKSKTLSSAPKSSDEVSEITFQEKLKGFFIGVAGISQFTGRFFKELFKWPFEFNEFLKQCYLAGYKTLPLVGITGFIMGVVLTNQSRPTLVEFGAESWLPSMVTISIIREIGPVITALICAGKVGSGIGAELASMKVTEQIEAMEVSGANAFKFLVVTRVLATTLMIPLLAIFSDVISFFGSYIAVNMSEDITFSLFFKMAFDSVEFIDLLPAVAKTFLFGAGIGLVGCYMGYNSEKGTEGVGKAANSAVVVGSLLVFVIDLIAVQITSRFL